MLQDPEIRQALERERQARLAHMKRIADAVTRKYYAEGRTRNAEAFGTAAERLFQHDDMTHFGFLMSMKRLPVSIDEFLESKDFIGGVDMDIWPQIALDIRKVNKDIVLGETPVFEYIDSGATGCHAPGALIALHDGGSKAIETIQKGDRLAGPDGIPRRVLALCSAKEEMRRLHLPDGVTHDVNKSHLLPVTLPDRRKDLPPLVMKVGQIEAMSPCQRAKFRMIRHTADGVQYLPFSIEKLPLARYFGFAIDRDHLYLAHDGSVHHNTGKTAKASITNAYQLYILHCLTAPQRLYGLAAQTPIVFSMTSSDLRTTADVLYRPFRSLIENIPFFRKYTTWNRDKKSVLEFDNHIQVEPVIATTQGIIGRAIIAAHVDECVTGDTLINTRRGDVPIAQIVPGDKVLAFGTDGVTYDRVLVRKDNGEQRVRIITFSDGRTLRLTDNHPLLTPAGWCYSKDIRKGDEVYAIPTHPHPQALDQGRKDTSGKAADTERGTHSARQESQHGGEGSTGPLQRRTRGPADAHAGSEGQGAGREDRAQALGRNATEDVGGSDPQQYVAGLPGKRAFNLYKAGNTAELLAFEARSLVRRLHGDDERDHQFPIRDGEGAVSSGRAYQEHGRGFSGADHRRAGAGGGKSQLRGRAVPGQDYGSAEVRGIEWLDVSGLDRVRVVAVEGGGIEPVFNLHTEKTHSFAANGIVTHNCNYMSVVFGSTRAGRGDGRNGVYDQADSFYRAVRLRKKSRFSSTMPVPGHIILSSSAKHTDDFLDRRIAEVKGVAHEDGTEGEPGVEVFRHKQYEVQPAGRFSKKTFRLLVGTAEYSTRILGPDERPGIDYPENAQIENVPENYRYEFTHRPEDALRDVCGISTVNLSPFITQRHKIRESHERWTSRGNAHPVHRDNVDLAEHGMPVLRPELLDADTETPRFVHIDLSRTGDRCGIAMTRIDDIFELPIGQEMDSGGMVYERVPYFTTELAISIRPSQAAPLDIAAVRNWVVELKTVHRVPIYMVTYDGFDSAESVQALRAIGIRSEVISLDRSDEGYTLLRRALYQDRADVPPNEILTSELINLEKDEKSGKVDHPPKGSKDISDAVAGSMFAAVTSRPYRTQFYFTNGQGQRILPPGR